MKNIPSFIHSDSSDITAKRCSFNLVRIHKAVLSLGYGHVVEASDGAHGHPQPHPAICADTAVQQDFI